MTLLVDIEETADGWNVGYQNHRKGDRMGVDRSRGGGGALLPCLLAAILWAAAGRPGAADDGIGSLEQLVGMGPAQLEQIYRQAGPGVTPEGRVQGRALLFPGTKLAGPASKFARILWQGKVFRSEDGTAINRFFGMRVIRGRVYPGPSWLDGRPSMILDYQGTSVVYGKNRDEIRQIAPGLYLGVMYARTSPQPTRKMYFALDAR